MLLLRSIAKGSNRLSASQLRCRHRPYVRGSTLAATFSRLPLRARRLSGTPTSMLRAAAEEHDRKSHGSSQFVMGGASQTTHNASGGQPNPSYRSPLDQAPASTLNMPRQSQLYARPSSGVKRTASGLAKSLSGSFQDGAGSLKQPYVVLDDSPAKSKTSQTAQTALFNENDFDSDIELEIEEPKPLNAVTYPKLPQQPSSKPALYKPAFYPTLPKQQQVQQSCVYDEDVPLGSPYRPVGPNAHKAPGSSAPLPWSSSPIGHAESFGLPHSSKKLARDIEHGKMAASGNSSGKFTAPAPAPAPARKRTLPWSEESEEQSATPATYSSKPKIANSKVPGMFTPRSKADKKDAFPWNTSASAVKEQQKQHREETRRAAKQAEVADESAQTLDQHVKRPAQFFLSDEQKHVLDLVVEKKKSVFFTGSAGTGKSVLMREIIASLRRKFIREPDRVAVTASTGLAACNVGGVTLHSFAGIGLGKEEVPELVKKIKRNQKARHRWMRTKVLVVDEVSMVDGELFDKLEAIARQIRNNARPFGGIQLVITGDFFQLPPVPDNNRAAKFAFDGATWRTSVEHTIALHHVFRQKDPVFAGMLNEMREGRLTESSIKAFRSLSRPLNSADMLEATELFPTRAEVDRANSERLRLLQGNVEVYEARDGGTITDKMQRDRLLQNCMAPESITLKKGAQVMLIKNIDETLVNGSIGRVVAFFSEAEFDRYHINESEFTRSPGGSISEPQTHGINTARRWPLVRFHIPDGTYRELLCTPEPWKIELPNGEVQASRSQTPLILAWSLSIHKAQGQTLERVKVDLGRVFEKGQAYVALSRATSMAGLQVLRFDPKKVNAHERVRTFYSNLSRVELENKSRELSDKGAKQGVNASDYERQFVEA